MARTRVVLCFISVLAAGVICAGTALASGQQNESQETIEVLPIRIVVLVDESGSLTSAAVAEERRAAALIGLSELSTRSQVAVIGFGSSNGPGQSAVDEVCPLTDLSDVQARQSIADCVQSIRPRKTHEGADTDHAAAIRAALDIFGQADPLKRAPVAFLLTDGVLDVHNSPAYGPDPASRNREAQQQLDHEILPDAKRAGVQIWPLGFGSA